MKTHVQPYQAVEEHLRNVYPLQPTHAQIVSALKQEPKWVSNAVAKLKKLGLAHVDGRAQRARWRLSSMTYENASSANLFEPDPNAPSYAVLAAMQQIARQRQMKGMHP